MNEEQEQLNQNQPQEQTVSHGDDKHELDLMEMEIFRHHWKSLNAALAEIRELRGADAPEIDPVEFVKHEVANLKNQFSELKEMIADLRQTQPAQQPMPQQQIPRYQQMQMQPTVPILPYYSTPNFAPIIPINQ